MLRIKCLADFQDNLLTLKTFTMAYHVLLNYLTHNMTSFVP
jgi:hypothetical protein